MIKFDNIKIQFDDRVLFENFSLHIKSGEKVLLNGPSGRGKSSLLKAALGFVPLKAGSIFIDSEENTGKSIYENRGKIAYVSQDVDLMPTTGYLFIEEIYTYKHNKHLEYDENRIKALISFFDLSETLLHKNIQDLSGGERQRLGLVIAFLLDRDILLLDEITSALDQNLKERVVSRIMTSNKTVMVISHDDIWQQEKIKVVNI